MCVAVGGRRVEGQPFEPPVGQGTRRIDALQEIQAVIDNTSYEELCQILTDSLASWADTQTDYEITDTSIEFSEDPLLMDEQRKEKLYNNWTVSVNIQLAGDEKSKYDVPDAAAIYRQAADALRSTPYGAYKLHTLKITASSDPDRILTSEQEGRFFLTDSAFSLPQEPEELAIQKTVLEQVEEFNQEYFSGERYRGQNVTLKRFGSPRDSSVLYLEFPIYAPPFDQDMAAFADSLEAHGQEFFHVITENNENLEYLKKCGITSVTVRFVTSWATPEKAVRDFVSYLKNCN